MPKGNKVKLKGEHKRVKKITKKVIKEEPANEPDVIYEPEFVYKNGVRLELTPRLKEKMARRPDKYSV